MYNTYMYMHAPVYIRKLESANYGNNKYNYTVDTYLGYTHDYRSISNILLQNIKHQ